MSDANILKTSEMSDAELEELGVIAELNAAFESAYLAGEKSVDISQIATRYKDNDRQWMAISRKIWQANHSIDYDHAGSGDIKSVVVTFDRPAMSCGYGSAGCSL